MILEKMRNALERLQQALEEGDGQRIRHAQQEVSQAFRLAWEKYQQGDIRTQIRGQALPRTMYLFATEELPAAVDDPARWPALRHELGNFRRLMDLVIAPEEN